MPELQPEEPGVSLWQFLQGCIICMMIFALFIRFLIWEESRRPLPLHDYHAPPVPTAPYYDN